MLGVEGLTPTAFAGVALITMVGATLQGAVGFGMGMLAVPVLLLIDPAFVPGPTLMTMSLLTLAMTWRERHAVQVRQLAWAIGGRIPGVVAALAFLTIMPANAAGPVFGVLVLLAVGLSASGLHLRPRPGTLMAAGAMSGFMGTTVSIGGPPMALLFQHEPGPQVRATLSAFFTIGVAISLAGLMVIGRFGWGELLRVGVLLPGTVVGFLVSHRLGAALDRGHTRRAVLVVSAVMGVAVIGKYALTSASTPVRVVTYNIRHGRGMDDALDLERTAAVLRDLAPDIVGLQEVDSAAERSGGVHQADSIGTLLGMHHAFGAFMPYQGGAYGMAILSRYPIVRSTALRLPEGNEPRVALMVVVALPGGEQVTVVNVHFDWVEDDGFRFAQASALAAVLDTLAGPVLLLGDFNDVPGSRTLGLFADWVHATKPPSDHFTFSSTEPAKEIDHIVMGPRGGWQVLSVQVVGEPMASDHRPVLAVLESR